MLTELQIVGAPTPLAHMFSEWRVTVNVYAPASRVIKIAILSRSVCTTKHMHPHNRVPKTAPNAAALQSIAVCDWRKAKHNNQSTKRSSKDNKMPTKKKPKQSDEKQGPLTLSAMFSTDKTTGKCLVFILVNDLSFLKSTHHLALSWVIGPMTSENNLKLYAYIRSAKKA